MDKEKIIESLKRVADIVYPQLLTYDLYEAHQNKEKDPSTKPIIEIFGSWNEAKEAAELPVLQPGGQKYSEMQRLEADNKARQQLSNDEVLLSIFRLSEELRKRPSESQIAAKLSSKHKIECKKRWGSALAAFKTAYQKFGKPPDPL
jgi:hypothetical protein